MLNHTVRDAFVAISVYPLRRGALVLDLEREERAAGKHERSFCFLFIKLCFFILIDLS